MAHKFTLSLINLPSPLKIYKINRGHDIIIGAITLYISMLQCKTFTLLVTTILSICTSLWLHIHSLSIAWSKQEITV